MHPDLKERIIECLRNTRPSDSIADWRLAGMRSGAMDLVRAELPEHPIPASVLIPLVDREQGLTVLLTQRAEGLKNHAGQISFPGGRIESVDAGPLAAAMRETHEEIGLEARFVNVIGYLPDHLVISGYRVTPVVALIRPEFSLALDASEVVATFEVPLAHVFDPRNHSSRRRRIGNQEIEIHDIPFGERNIWGATAGMLITLYSMLGATSNP